MGLNKIHTRSHFSCFFLYFLMWLLENIKLLMCLILLLDNSDLIICVKISKLQNDRYSMKESINTAKHVKQSYLLFMEHIQAIKIQTYELKWYPKIS